MRRFRGAIDVMRRKCSVSRLAMTIVAENGIVGGVIMVAVVMVMAIVMMMMMMLVLMFGTRGSMIMKLSNFWVRKTRHRHEIW